MDHLNAFFRSTNERAKDQHTSIENFSVCFKQKKDQHINYIHNKESMKFTYFSSACGQHGRQHECFTCENSLPRDDPLIFRVFSVVIVA